MNKYKYGMVSSFNVLCGNATYSESLCQGIEKIIKDKVHRLDLGIKIQKYSDSESINNIIKEIKNINFLNFQFELGLYGHTPWDAYKNIKKILQQYSGAGTVCFHRFDSNLISVGYLRYIKSLLYSNKNISLLKKFSFIIEKSLYYHQVKITETIYYQIAKIFYKKKFKFIVHTYRESKSLKFLFPNAEIVVHPIMWPEYIVESKSLSDFSIKFKNDLPVVGLFGFISEYKNYDIAVESLRKYKNFNLLIVGSQHPQNPTYGKKTNSYISMLSDSITYKPNSRKIPLEDRFDLTDYVVWRSWMTENELVQLTKAVDIVAVPYLETGQSGSGIASMAIQYANKVIFSDTRMTSELEKFTDKLIPKFDVVSTVSFSHALIESLSCEKPIFQNSYTFLSNIKNYLPSD